MDATAWIAQACAPCLIVDAVTGSPSEVEEEDLFPGRCTKPLARAARRHERESRRRHCRIMITSRHTASPAARSITARIMSDSS